jgi:hypothetical protein
MELSFFSLRAFKPLNQSGDDLKLNGSDFYGVPTLTSLAFQYEGKKIELLECVVTVNQEKNIVSTPMQGRDGTIKEYISDGDYSISVDAAVCSYVVNQNSDVDYGQSHAYPLEKLEDLIRFLKIKDTLEVQSDFLTLFGVKNIVIKSYGMVQETHSNRQSFQIQMLSDTPFEIKIKQDVAINK